MTDGATRARAHAAPVLLAVLSLALASCDRIPGTDCYLISKAEHAAADHMVDPKRATFTSIQVGQAGASPIVCGVAHGRNRAAGYTDPVRFLGTETVANFDPGPPDPREPASSQRNLAAPDYLFKGMWRSAGCRWVDGTSKV